jgi:site-specific recombinase XerD
MKYIVDGDIVLSQPPNGPLAAHLKAFAKWASEQGYARYSRYRQVLLAAGWSRWLGQRAVRIRRVSSEQPASYLRSRARRVRRHRGDTAALTQFVEFLRSRRVIPAEKRALHRLTAVEEAGQAFERYLRDERGLARATQRNYLPFIHAFLTDRFGNGSVRLARLCARDVVRFVQRQAPRLHPQRAKLLTSALRSFLHYARYRGDVMLDLAAAVPAVANWSMPAIPRAIPAESVRQLLRSISRRTATGCRDYAIVLVLARLGLRASEVAFLDLEDMDWPAGCVRVRGKGGRRIEVPLLAEVGDAIVAYLRHGRPSSASRRVFLRSKAPIRGFLGASAIGSIVRHRLQRAGVEAPTTGAHQFRHALATQMLRHGASLSEIGEVLGHRSPETTKIYTKVDLEALGPLALPWPGGVR